MNCETSPNYNVQIEWGKEGREGERERGRKGEREHKMPH
jgi:hypothetical protein